MGALVLLLVWMYYAAAVFFIGALITAVIDERMLAAATPPAEPAPRSEEHTSELQSLMRISYAVFCLKKKRIKRQSELQNPNSETKRQKHQNTKKKITLKQQ